MSSPLSRENLPENPCPDDILNVFLEYLASTNTEPYDHQEEAILELFAGNNVIDAYFMGQKFPASAKHQWLHLV